ncbi:hypothetical protein [Extensimonas sp. H3M7-6]|uniref:hypothetical protein n=1 Tax=Extensimonas soli TaxID=3031322 RepID=UPI0023DBF4D5|nr:hypothetical protein [Extensimonas sp. H3M7-6]MDF1483296.1 hypothetical protein [Extensimonas sp. H3M7-6]
MCADKSAPATLDATPAQQRVLERIAVQRERLRARHTARRQAQVRTHEAASAAAAADGAAPGGLYPPDAPFAERLALFARAHPAVAGAVAAALIAAAGPRRVLRWATVALPWVLRLRSR